MAIVLRWAVCCVRPHIMASRVQCPQSCHPDWSVSGMEGSIAVGTMQEGARIPPLRFAPVGMTSGVVRSECLPPLSSRLERKRNGGIYRSGYDAGGCEDSSTTLRFGRNDISGWCGRNVHPLCHPGRGTPHVCHPAPPNGVIPTGAYHHPCHPDWSVSGMEGSIAVGAMWEGARIPPLRFASVGMTWG